MEVLQMPYLAMLVGKKLILSSHPCDLDPLQNVIGFLLAQSKLYRQISRKSLPQNKQTNFMKIEKNSHLAGEVINCKAPQVENK